MMRLLSGALSLAAVAGLAACELPDSSLAYGPTGGSTNRVFGYSERKNDDGTYILTVRFVFDPRRTDEIMAIWDRRASELCEGGAYDKAIYKSVRESISDGYNVYPANSVILEGLLTCEPSSGTPAASAIEVPSAAEE